MRHSTDSATARLLRTNWIYFLVGGVLLCALFCMSLFIGKYPLTIDGLLSGNDLQWRVFKTLRLSRTLAGCFGGFALAIAGYIYQTVFRNSLASPDIIGVSSGASAGAAVGILFLGSSVAITLCSFGGAILAVILALAFASIDKSGHKSTVVLAGIAVHSIAQTILMCLKLTADPEKELASIEYWIMGSLNNISSHSMIGNLILCAICVILSCLLHRQTLLLSADEGEAQMLGVNVATTRLIVLALATIMVASIVSMTGLISFVGLVAPHCAKKLTGNNKLSTMLLAGIIGGCLLTAADILARSIAATELPVSIFTSLIGAPFLIYLIAGGKQKL
ncbi:MAG: iron ABC transporter permease [Saccharofermentans sp.]|nr:iron ABC transporter permease [Saccharofermentans sp.]